MTRRCSRCGHDGHNTRTCPEARGVKLFGVRITDGSIRKCASMGNLVHCSGSSCGDGAGSPVAEHHDDDGDGDGYASEELAPRASGSRERKKGIPWTEEEHRMFLLGLKKLGKGDWRGISKTYVVSRSPTQVASHAQKYFIRQVNASRRKRRSSLFDIVSDEPSDAQTFSMDAAELEGQGGAPLAAPDAVCEELPDSICSDVPDGRTIQNALAASGSTPYGYPVLYPAYYPPFYPVPVPLWPGYQPGATTSAATASEGAHQIVKPTAVHSKNTPINVDELVGMSKLSISQSSSDVPAPVSTKIGGSGRQSAFHANQPASGSSMKTSTTAPIHAL